MAGTPRDVAPPVAPDGTGISGETFAPPEDSAGMQQIASRYRRVGGASLIEISINSLEQLFNTLDPSPFHQKDLDADAEDYIVGAARELPTRERLKLVLHIRNPQSTATDPTEVARWIQGYFSYRRQAAARDLRFVFSQGRKSLAIGVGFLTTCLLARELLLGTTNPVLQVVAESLLIAGWVAMWRPLDVILYDWWPLRRMGKVYGKLAHIPVEIVAARH